MPALEQLPVASNAAREAATPKNEVRQPAHAPGVSDLFGRWQERGDRVAREALVERFLPLARSLARRYERSPEPFEDLLQVASLGLVKAIDRFDAQRGLAFASFAVPTILGELRRYFRDSGWSVHVPRGFKDRALKLEAAQRVLTTRTGRAPTVSELAQYLELDAEEVLDAMRAAQAHNTVSLDAPRRTQDDHSESLGDAIGDDDERFELIECDIAVTGAIRQLPERDRRILRLRFIDDLTQTEIAQQIGVSQMQVSRLLRRSLARLRTLADPERPAAELRPGAGCPLPAVAGERLAGRPSSSTAFVYPRRGRAD